MKNKNWEKNGKGKVFGPRKNSRRGFLGWAVFLFFAVTLAGLPSTAHGSFLDLAFETSTVKNSDPPGDPAAQDYGTTRLTIDYNSGDNASQTTVTLTRSDAGVNLPDLSLVANAVWYITTDRTNFTADLSFHFLDDEILGIPADVLAVYQAPTLGGPFTQLSSELNDVTNTLTVRNVTEFSYFIIKDTSDGACFIGSLLQGH